MKQIIYLLLSVIALTSFSQTNNVYLKLTNVAGQFIRGDAVQRGFERQIAVQTFSTGGKNNTQLSFTMNITGASAELKQAINNGSLLPNGELTVTQYGTVGIITVYTVKMENIRVSSCSESMGCGGVLTTSAVMNASRIGWTYYQTDRSGNQVVTKKYGYDSDTGREWTNF